jgi:DNA-binding NtrC family response regulator
MRADIQIFIVDDDPFWSAILKEMLTNLGYTNLSQFNNGNDCVKNLSLQPTLIFLDYQMRNVDGLTTLREIKKYDPLTCVIFCTAYAEISIVIDAMKFGSSDFLPKENVTPEKLESVIESLHINKAFSDKVF